MPTLDHVGIKVTDLDRSVKFYQDLFGFEELERRRIGRGIDTVALKVGVNLLFLLNREDFTERDPESLSGVDHFAICYDGAEWEAVTARAREMGVRIVQQQPSVQGATGRGPCVYILDPDGNEIELKHGGYGTFGPPEPPSARAYAEPVHAEAVHAG